MILQPSNVELTKIHYYEKNLCGEKIPTISQEIEDKNLDRNVIIKKNIFGHKWVLKVNENDDEVKKSKLKLVLYIWVFLSITTAFGFGIFFALNNTIFKNREQYINGFIYPDDAGMRSRPQIETTNTTTISYEDYIENNDGDPTEYTSTTTERKPYCLDCSPTDICMKLNDSSKPECVVPIDYFDPTGCGGLCLINTEYCQMLSQKYNVYQCLPRKFLLTCNDYEFNCQNMCINGDKRCDGNIDCSNRLDEKNCECDLSFNFQCGENTSCLDLSLKCNGIQDCWDGSDELNCYYDTPNVCDPEEFRCNNGFCISKDQMCDGLFDCSDNSDEPEGCIDL